MQSNNLQVASREPSGIRVDVDSIPQSQSDTLARVILHGIDQAFKDPTFAAEYERWKQERSTKKATAQAAGSL